MKKATIWCLNLYKNTKKWYLPNQKETYIKKAFILNSVKEEIKIFGFNPKTVYYIKHVSPVEI